MENSDEVLTLNFPLTLLWYSNSFQQKYFGVDYPSIKMKANNRDLNSISYSSCDTNKFT